QAGEKDLDLTLDIPESGPAVMTDGDKVRQVLVNLLSNAVKYTDEGSVTLTVEPTDDGGATLTVDDTGIGIEAANLPRIFDPFWQAESPNTRTAGGTGLGLSVNQRLVALLGGTIDVESEPGMGSTFIVRLPPVPPKDRPSLDRATGDVTPPN
ncbi:MAG: sensor histidine kinase, partial [Candidatus Longimicrobiales bacterium M2_2A_002]